MYVFPSLLTTDSLWSSFPALRLRAMGVTAWPRDLQIRPRCYLFMSARHVCLGVHAAPLVLLGLSPAVGCGRGGSLVCALSNSTFQIPRAVSLSTWLPTTWPRKKLHQLLPITSEVTQLLTAGAYMLGVASAAAVTLQFMICHLPAKVQGHLRLLLMHGH